MRPPPLPKKVHGQTSAVELVKLFILFLTTVGKKITPVRECHVDRRHFAYDCCLPVFGVAPTHIKHAPTNAAEQSLPRIRRFSNMRSELCRGTNRLKLRHHEAFRRGLLPAILSGGDASARYTKV
ncbi:unnamed protein product [Hermetia illucens]|uniref:Uncharacterized protein n=1 Tax=Hermetia illucens TaxID=343691 RepID=A0A7R8UH71_HERIL|nr:unnamed protein product [Hermetia illucens]